MTPIWSWALVGARDAAVARTSLLLRGPAERERVLRALLRYRERRGMPAEAGAVYARAWRVAWAFGGWEREA